MQNEQKKTRGRPRNVDTALVPPPNALRKIRQISRETKIPLEQVYEDALSNGIVTLPEMYSSIIKFRKEREKLYESQFDDELAEESDTDAHERIEARKEDEFIDSEFRVDSEEESSGEEGSFNAVKRSGLESEVSEDFRSDE